MKGAKPYDRKPICLCEKGPVTRLVDYHWSLGSFDRSFGELFSLLTTASPFARRLARRDTTRGDAEHILCRQRRYPRVDLGLCAPLRKQRFTGRSRCGAV